MKDEDIIIELKVTAPELRYLISCGFALSGHVPEESLPAYCGFTKDEVLRTSKKLRKILEDHGLDM
jgi:tetrahydromethanopterin S-methyltransferase subunit A